MLKHHTFNNAHILARKLALAGGLLAVVGVGGCAQNGSFGMTTGSLANPAANGSGDANKPLKNRSIPQTRAAYRAAPKSTRAALTYARALRLSGKKKRALAVLDKAAKHHVKNRQIAKTRGFLSLELGRIADAERHLRRALDPDSPDWRVRSALGSALASQGKQQQAQMQFAKALELKPDHPSILNNLALSYALDGNAKRAEWMLQLAARSSAGKKRISQNLALLKRLKTTGKPVSVAGNAQNRKRTAARSKDYTVTRRLRKANGSSSKKLVSK